MSITGLAQSFIVEDEPGIFLSKCRVYFTSKPTNDTPVFLEIRSMIAGVPSTVIVDPGAVAELSPDEISVSATGDQGSDFVFKYPIYLEGNSSGGKYYCICLKSQSSNYSVAISRSLENDLITDTFVSNSSDPGSLFKSENGSTWDPSQFEDLKYVLYRADFVPSGIAQFDNPILNKSNNQVAKLLPNAITLNSRKIRIALGSTLTDTNLTLGNTVSQLNSDASGIYVGSAGSAHGLLNVINPGIGYTPSAGSYTFTNVSLISITGSGQNATANITVADGSIVAAGVTIVNGGRGYNVGDILSISSLGVDEVGRNARLSVGIITSVNEIILDNVQGTFTTSGIGTLQYKNNIGNIVSLNGGGVKVNSVRTISDGLHAKIYHQNHGMHSNQNSVEISGVRPDIRSTKLTSDLDISTSVPQTILVEDTTSLQTFEGVGVGTTNRGYVMIGDTVLSYTSVSSGVIGGEINILELGDYRRVRYPAGTDVYKYELCGVSLRRINTTHRFINVDPSIIPNPITLDSYHIKLDMSNGSINPLEDTGIVNRNDSLDFPKLYINQTKSSGGSSIYASQNVQFETIYPNVKNITVSNTSISAALRTTSGTSISGEETSFVDEGYSEISINQNNYMNTPRIIGSSINEISNLSETNDYKSLTMKFLMSTSDSRVSPIIETVSLDLVTNRINSEIEDYANDNRVNSIFDDPTAFQYITKEINLENSATSIKLILDAYINSYSDIRAFYSISDNPNYDPVFIPFPGYSNLNSDGQIINFEDSNGASDDYITPSSILSVNRVDYREYTFTADDLPSFRNFRIKLIGAAKNQVYVPRIKNLRVLALA